MINCRNKGTLHAHSSVDDVKRCYGILPPLYAGRPSATTTAPARPYSHREAATKAQLDYIEILGGDVLHAAKLTKQEASAYIERLKKEKEKKPVTAPTHPSAPATRVPIELLRMVPAGRFAVRRDSNEPYTFLRISEPKNGRYKDCLKVQTQHGPALSEAKFVVWPSGQVSCYTSTIEEPLMLVIADYRTAARAYGRELGRCCRCATELTDERSRHYGIGPECEKYWPWIITQVDEEDAG